LLSCEIATLEEFMSLRLASVLAFALMVAGLVWMLVKRVLLARSGAALAVQIAAVLLMVWARITFGRRSFHAAANPTSGGLVTTGPYAYVRHPIYAAVTYFAWAGALDHHTAVSVAGALLLTCGAFVRMLAEEQLLMEMYPAYAAYRARTARVVPFLL
jgi:protein-S-isoprenylcysteine O-methyltransferase Ste14